MLVAFGTDARGAMPGRQCGSTNVDGYGVTPCKVCNGGNGLKWLAGCCRKCAVTPAGAEMRISLRRFYTQVGGIALTALVANKYKGR